MDNPTIVVITDRNGGRPAFDTFAASKQLLRQSQYKPKIETNWNFKSWFGWCGFTTIQKFQPDNGNVYELLSNRENIVVIADEAHRTQYGLKPKPLTIKMKKAMLLVKK